jgi:IS30 family transposase
MKKTYTHLSHFERGRIFEWSHYQRLSLREIARRLNRSHTTISREIRRNKHWQYVPTYYPNIAQRKADYRLSTRAKRCKLKSTKTQQFVINRLKVGWTPEIIAGYLKYNNPKVPYVSHEAIYQFIYKESPGLICYLPRKHKCRRKRIPYRKGRSNIANKTMICERPEKINNRKEFGHWESDSVESVDRKSGLNVLVERSSRLTHISKLDSKKSSETKRAIEKRLSRHPSDLVKSITYDNGSENARHQEINEKLKTDSYFCLPYHSWEKGAVEQINSLIRRFIPKKTDISELSGTDIYKIEKLLNNRPRKCLKFKTPYEVFRKQCGALQF